MGLASKVFIAIYFHEVVELEMVGVKGQSVVDIDLIRMQ